MRRASTRGQVNHVAWRYAIAGGNWLEGVRYGARTLNLNANAWNANGNIGVRGVSDALAADQHPRCPGEIPGSMHPLRISRFIPARMPPG
jgi:hypothetical protein